jgi:hypothetical protein
MSTGMGKLLIHVALVFPRSCSITLELACHSGAHTEPKGTLCGVRFEGLALAPRRAVRSGARVRDSRERGWCGLRRASGARSPAEGNPVHLDVDRPWAKTCRRGSRCDPQQRLEMATVWTGANLVAMAVKSPTRVLREACSFGLLCMLGGYSVTALSGCNWTARRGSAPRSRRNESVPVSSRRIRPGAADHLPTGRSSP